MNFNPEASPYNMPELGWFLGYPFALATMLSIAIGMLLFFRRKGWLGAGASGHYPSDHDATSTPR